MGAGINMADTGKLEEDIDDLGTLGIILEAYNLLSIHSQVFMSIHFTLMLPLALLAVAFDFIIYRNFPPQDPSNFKVFFHVGDSGLRLGTGLVPFLLLAAVFIIAFEAALSLSSSAMLHVVGLHYAGESVNFRDVLRVSIPHLWMRLTVTNIWKTLFLYPMFILQTVASLLLFLHNDGIAFFPSRLGLVGTLGMVGTVYFETIFMLAGGVSVLGKDCGWAAVKRSLKLLKGRLIVAIEVQLLLLIPTIFLVAVQSIFRYRTSFGEDGLLVMPLAIPCIYFMTYIWQMKAVCAGIEYESFQAFHNKDKELEESIYMKGAAEWRYEGVGRAIYGPKFEPQARSHV